MILLQAHRTFLNAAGTNHNSQVENDIMELGERVTMCLDDENNLWGAAGMYWWRTQEYSPRGCR